MFFLFFQLALLINQIETLRYESYSNNNVVFKMNFQKIKCSSHIDTNSSQ